MKDIRITVRAYLGMIIGRVIIAALLIILPLEATARAMECQYDFVTHIEFVIVRESKPDKNSLTLKIWNEGSYEGEPSIITGVQQKGGFFIYDSGQNQTNKNTPIGPVVGFVDFERARFNMMFAILLEGYFLGNDPLVKHSIQHKPFKCRRLD